MKEAETEPEANTWACAPAGLPDLVGAVAVVKISFCAREREHALTRLTPRGEPFPTESNRAGKAFLVVNTT